MVNIWLVLGYIFFVDTIIIKYVTNLYTDQLPGSGRQSQTSTVSVDKLQQFLTVYKFVLFDSDNLTIHLI
jgi:hypothetical protein